MTCTVFSAHRSRAAYLLHHLRSIAQQQSVPPYIPKNFKALPRVNLCLIKNLKNSNSLAIVMSYNNNGVVLWEQGKSEEALEQYRRYFLEIQEEKATNLLVVATSYSNIVAVLRQQERLEEGLEQNRRALEIQEEKPPNSLDVARFYNKIGTVLNDQGRLDEALEQYLHALEIQEEKAPNSLGA